MTKSVFHDERYQRLAKKHAEEYRTGSPFPHISFDDFLPEELCNEILNEFPDKDGIPWIEFQGSTGVKLASNRLEYFESTISNALQSFNTAPFLNFLEELTGITGLLPDPYYEGGGLHQIGPGGFLKIHADFNYHEHLKVDRRINVLLYLNQDWKEEYGGHLELWNREMTTPIKKILPLFNRLAIFSTTDFSYHGHPDPITCPEGMSRKSIALYYYTNGRPEDERSASHSTLYKQRPEELEKLNSPSSRMQKTFYSLCMGAAWLWKKPANLLEIIADRFRPSEF